jgi:hypothetical protein
VLTSKSTTFVWVVAGLMSNEDIHDLFLPCNLFGTIYLDIGFALARLCYGDFRSQFRSFALIRSFMRIIKALSINHGSFMAFLHMGDMELKKRSYFQAQGAISTTATRQN